MDNTEHQMLMTNSPQYAQQDMIPGLFKGVVIDVRDPFQLGRVRVWVYNVHGGFYNLNIDAIPWAEPVMPLRRGFSPPELFDRVWVSFNGGDKFQVVYLGYWYAIPVGTGTLPFDAGIGSEVRPENWHHHDLYPETLMVGCDGEGNALWFEDKLLDQDSLASAINIMDTSGKYIRTRSYHPGITGYAPIQKIEEIENGSTGGKATLDGKNIPPGEPSRNGAGGAPPIAAMGSVELGHQNVFRSLLTDDADFSVDMCIQMEAGGEESEDKSVGCETQLVGGSIANIRQAASSVSLVDSTLFLMGVNGVFIGDLFTTPRRWD